MAAVAELGRLRCGCLVFDLRCAGGHIRNWGEVFPRWIPFLGGRRVPIPLAVAPASPVSVLVTTTGLMFVRLTLSGKLAAIPGEGVLRAGNWAALVPELLWPVWGVASAAATLAYYYRRRGKCGRGEDYTTS